MRFMNQQLAVQKEQYAKLTESVNQARTARHDMRHQLLTISEYTASGSMEKLQSYLCELTGVLSRAADKTYCENQAVNALICHYAAMTEREGMQTNLRLEVPEDCGVVSSIDLCVGVWIASALVDMNA